MTKKLDQFYLFSPKATDRISNLASAAQMPKEILHSESILKELPPKELQRLKQEAEQEKSFATYLGNVGGGTVAQVTVKNGRIIRIRPLDYTWKYKPEEIRGWKISARGKSFEPPKHSTLGPFVLAYRKRVYAPNRVMYPMKRVDFDPKGDRHPENRGKSRYVRISWNEALDIITNEVKRVKQKYGSSAILVESDGHGSEGALHGPHGIGHYLFSLLGGATYQIRNPDSWEGWYWGAKHVWGYSENVGRVPDDYMLEDVLENTELLVCWSVDDEKTQWFWRGQEPCIWNIWTKQVGIKRVYISPDCNAGCGLHGDKWIPILPGTDTALALAIAYVWIKEGTYEKEYVNTHGYGFDKFKDYILGVEDGIEKTPEWAEPITRVPARITWALAREWGSKRTSILSSVGAAGRTSYAHEWARMMALLLAMQGLGKPGVGLWALPLLEGVPSDPNFKLTASQGVGGDKSRITLGPLAKGWPLGNTSAVYLAPGQYILRTLIPEAILNPPVSWYSGPIWAATASDQFVKRTFPKPGQPGIRMIYSDTASNITNWNTSNKWVKAFRSPNVEFYAVQHPWLQNDCMFADIILPVNTPVEREDIFYIPLNYSVLVHMAKCIEPLGESKSDLEIYAMLADKLGVKRQFMEGKSPEDYLKEVFKGIKIPYDWKKFKEIGYYIFPFPNMDEYLKSKPKPGMKAYYDLPEGRGLETPSGKLEFYSKGIADHFPDDKERPPVPHWIPYGETNQESLMHERAKKYPLVVLSPHPRYRGHSSYTVVSWIKDGIPGNKVKGPDGYLYEALWINPEDAAKRGLKTGDVLKIFNERGEVLAAAFLSERVIPGVVQIPNGAMYDPIIPGKLDRGGCIDTISPGILSKNAAGQNMNAYLAEVEKVDLDALRKQYPEEFARSDQRAKFEQNAWVVG